MTDRNRAGARSNEMNEAKTDKTDKTEREIAAQAVRDNMAKLKALRLAREAAEPPRPAAVKKARTKSPKKLEEKAPALSDWLAGRQSGGHRT
jgi:hypothetical protein